MQHDASSHAAKETVQALRGVLEALNSDDSYISKVRFEVFTAVTMKNGVFCVVTPCGSCKNRRYGGT
jgi:hypothetical protein